MPANSDQFLHLLYLFFAFSRLMLFRMVKTRTKIVPAVNTRKIGRLNGDVAEIN